jgi:lipopolysaccharide export system permease protein
MIQPFSPGLPWRMWTYIGGKALGNILVCLLAMAVSIALIDMVEQVRAASELDGGGFWLGVRFVLLRLPGLLEQTLVFAVLIGIVLTFVGLSRHAEIIAFRAAGYSAWQFVLPAAAVAAMIGVFVIVLLGPVGASLGQRYEIEKNSRSMAVQAMQDGQTALVWKTLPLGDGVALLSGIPDPADPSVLIRPTALILPNRGPILRIDANKAIKVDESWSFSEAKINSVGAVQRQFASYTIDGVQASSDSLDSELVREPKALPVWALPHAARTAGLRGGSVDRYWVRFHRQLSLPFLLVAVTLVAALLSLGLERAGNRAKLMASALSAGISIYLAAEVAGGLAAAGMAPAWSAAWAPPMLGLLLGLATLSIREDA